MTRPRPHSQPVAKPGGDPGLTDPKTPCGPGGRGEASLSVGRRVGGPWWGHPRLSGLEAAWGWGRPIVQSLRGDGVSGPNLLQPRGHQEPRDPLRRRLLTPLPGAPSPSHAGVGLFLSVSVSLPASQPLDSSPDTSVLPAPPTSPAAFSLLGVGPLWGPGPVPPGPAGPHP